MILTCFTSWEAWLVSWISLFWEVEPHDQLRKYLPNCGRLPYWLLHIYPVTKNVNKALKSRRLHHPNLKEGCQVITRSHFARHRSVLSTNVQRSNISLQNLVHLTADTFVAASEPSFKNLPWSLRSVIAGRCSKRGRLRFAGILASVWWNTKPDATRGGFGSRDVRPSGRRCAADWNTSLTAARIAGNIGSDNLCLLRVKPANFSDFIRYCATCWSRC